MYQAYDGTISLNKPLDKKAVAAMRRAKDISYGCFTGAKEGDTSIEVNSESGGTWLADELPVVIKKLKPLGYILNGTLERWGDNGDGVVYITENAVNDYSDADKWVVEATDEELAKLLRERGYQVLPKHIATNIVWDTDGEEVDLPTEVTLPYDTPLGWEADYLSDEYGFCVVSLVVEEVEI